MRSSSVIIAVGVLCTQALLAANTLAGGISVDAGLTPAQDRWIVRTQLRYMQRSGDPTGMGREMSRLAFPVVLAYGLRPNLTIMARQMVMHQEMTVMGARNRNTGFGDLFILAKYKAYRRNTSRYTLGIAPTLGLELPTGDDSFTAETWNLNVGLYLSGRTGPWAADFNLALAWNGFADQREDDVNPGDELSLDGALAHQLSLGEKAHVALAPVFELSYKDVGPDRLNGQKKPNTGESVFYLSPGFKCSMSWLILEALAQIPVWQQRRGSQLERNVGLLVGSRLMF
ncbi:MAG: hypothetical protein GTO24_22965 [candidate division Zixibacteria bacterium]|nr:hypothetical protein [candidate division Zixibacteria bacterium]